MNHAHLPPLAAALLTALALPAAARLELLPEDSAIRLHIPSVSNLCAALESSPPGRCWRDPAMQEFLGHPDPARWLPHHGAPAHLRDEIRHLQKESLLLLQEDLAIGLAPGPDAELYIAAQLSEPQYARIQELDRHIARLIPESITFVREEFQGVELLRATLVSPDKNTNTSWQAFVSNTYLDSTDRGWVEKSISRLQARPPAAAAAPYLLQGRADGGWLCALLEKAITPRPPRKTDNAATNAPPLFKPGDLIRALKISELQEVSFDVSAQDGRLRTALRINNRGCRQGIWTLLDPAPLPADWRLPYIPADAFAYNANRMNLAGLWEALPGMLNQISPALSASRQFFEAMLQQTFGIDLHNDLLRHLDTGYAACSRMRDGSSRELMYWQVKHPAEAAAALARLLADAAPLRMHLGENFQASEFRGRPIYTFARPAAGSNAWSLAVAGQYLVGGDDAMVRAALRAADAPGSPAGFYDSAAYQALLRFKPAAACSYESLDLGAAIRGHLAGARWRQIRQYLEQLNAKHKTLSGQSAGINFDRMPPADKIAAFFGPLLSYSAATADGWESVTVWTNP